MAINLQKGQRISLGLSDVTLGLGWDPNQSTGQDYDLDVSAFCLADNGKIPQDEYLIFYNNKFSPDGAIEGPDDDRTGASSDGDDDEQIKVNTNKLDAKIQEIIFIATIHDAAARNQNFGQIRNSYIRIVDNSNGSEIAKFELEEDFSIETSVEFGRLYKKGNEWKFQAVGDGYKEDLNFFLGKYT